MFNCPRCNNPCGWKKSNFKSDCYNSECDKCGHISIGYDKEEMMNERKKKVI